MTLRDTSKLSEPLADKAVAVFAGVDVCVTDHVCVRVIDGQMAVNHVVLVDVGIDTVVVSTEDDISIAVLGEIFVNVLEIFTNEKGHLSVVPADKCHDWRFVSRVGSAPLFESLRSRGLSCSWPFSPAVT